MPASCISGSPCGTARLGGPGEATSAADNLQADNMRHLWKSYLYHMQQKAPPPKRIICNEDLPNRPPHYGKEYHGTMERDEAERLVLAEGEGSYLVRESSREPGQYSLVFLFDGQPKNYRLYYTDNQHYVGSKRFNTLQDLVADGLITMYLSTHAGEYIRQMCDEVSYEDSPYLTINQSKKHMYYKSTRRRMKDKKPPLPVRRRDQPASSSRPIAAVATEDESYIIDGVLHQYDEPEFVNPPHALAQAHGLGGMPQLSEAALEDLPEPPSDLLTDDVSSNSIDVAHGVMVLNNPDYASSSAACHIVPELTSEQLGVGLRQASSLNTSEPSNIETGSSSQSQVQPDSGRRSLVDELLTQQPNQQRPASHNVVNVRCATAAHTNADLLYQRSDVQLRQQPNHRVDCVGGGGSKAFRRSVQEGFHAIPTHETSAPHGVKSSINIPHEHKAHGSPGIGAEQLRCESVSLAALQQGDSGLVELPKVTPKPHEQRHSRNDLQALSGSGGDRSEKHHAAVDRSQCQQNLHQKELRNNSRKSVQQRRDDLPDRHFNLPNQPPFASRSNYPVHHHHHHRQQQQQLQPVQLLRGAVRQSLEIDSGAWTHAQDDSDAVEEVTTAFGRITDSPSPPFPAALGGDGCVDRDDSDLETAQDDQLEDLPNAKDFEKSHAFKVHNFIGLPWCDFCGNFMWGLIAQGVKCEDCGFSAHSKCSEKVPSDCTPDMKFVKRVFGVDLTTLCKLYDMPRPFVIEMCIKEVELRGMQVEGLYRVSGSKDEIEHLQASFEQLGDQTPIDIKTYEDINVVSGCLKNFFRLLPIPLLPYDSYGMFVNAVRRLEHEDRLDGLRVAVRALPPAHYQSLKYLMQHLNRVTDHARMNKMSAENLSRIFAPTLLRSPDSMGVDLQAALQTEAFVVEMLIAHHKVVFDF